ncbi:glycoside hydrolase family 1 protein [Clostridium mediterraneense]|uniref:glycoside hydrolase family 1 protein n=1 Tax=Clostridium mediterraneense TaxID=1805472 RepID=UPI00082B30F9|nr:glycoside hydrolase family 1 protein [Clostridium mediterraneense]
MNKYVFPKDFWWGAATSGPQSEGRFNKANDSVFDYWFDISKETFHNGVGPNVASNFYNSYKEDIAMLKSIGLNSFRTSIQWSRLIKDFETGEVCPDAVRFYNDVIDECIKNNIDIIINLHHFDLPIDLYNKFGGWESKKVVDLYCDFAKKCFELFADRVDKWTTFNEPIVVVEGQYLYKFHYPCLVDGNKAVQVAYNINLASAKAIRAYKEGNYDGEIGIIVNLTPSYPRSNSKEDLEAANIADLFFNRMFLDPAVKGEFPSELVELLAKDNVLWESTEEELNIIRESKVDYLGINYYQPRRVKAREIEFEESTWMPDKYFENYLMPGRRINKHRGWEIYPEAIYDIAVNIKENYGNIKWYVSENGMGVEGEEKFINKDGMIEDDYRIDFIKEHLIHLHKAIEEGANCKGYHLWTPIDCWSWCNSYKNRYGFISLDLETLNKTIKKSGYWIKKVSDSNELVE